MGWYCIVDWVFISLFYVGDLTEYPKIFFTNQFSAVGFGIERIIHVGVDAFVPSGNESENCVVVGNRVGTFTTIRELQFTLLRYCGMCHDGTNASVCWTIVLQNSDTSGG
jgi:hypothetical protein